MIDGGNNKDFESNLVIDSNGVQWMEVRKMKQFTGENETIEYFLIGSIVPGSPALPVKYIGQNQVVDLATNDLGRDAWGAPKFSKDESIIHGMFTYNVPNLVWYEMLNGTELTAFNNTTSIDGKLNLESGVGLNDKVCLRTFRNPRYEPNRGYHYAISAFLPSPNADGNRKMGYFTSESGAFFSLESGVLYAAIRTTINTVTTVTKQVIDTTGLDLSKGNLFDIQMQWRGVGAYFFYINQNLVSTIDTIGTMVDLTIYNPANPIAFECENLGDNVVIQSGCVDVSSEGGKDNGKEYGSINMENENGHVGITGFNCPVMAIRSKPTVDSLINTRDTLMLLLSAYCDQRSFVRVWLTRDFTAITEEDQTWKDYGDGHLEYLMRDIPDITTPFTFDTAKAGLVFGSRVDQDLTYSTSALFEGRTNIYLTPGDMFIFTMHRETGAAANAGTTLEFAEAI